MPNQATSGIATIKNLADGRYRVYAILDDAIAEGSATVRDGAGTIELVVRRTPFAIASLETQLLTRAEIEAAGIDTNDPANGRVTKFFVKLAFEDFPDEIDFCRDPNPHVAFGLGTHFCLGANLARLTLRVFFEELAARIARVEALAPPVYEPHVFIKGVRRFDVRLHGRGSA